MDENQQLCIAAYCDPPSLYNLHQTSSNLSTLQMAICLPRTLIKALGIDDATPATIQEDVCIMQDLLRGEPQWVTQLWSIMSDHLYHETPPLRRGAFRRPSTGWIPQNMTLHEARRPETWGREQESARYPARLLQHEVYRIDRLHLKRWRRNAPTAVALIY